MITSVKKTGWIIVSTNTKTGETKIVNGQVFHTAEKALAFVKSKCNSEGRYGNAPYTWRHSEPVEVDVTFELRKPLR